MQYAEPTHQHVVSGGTVVLLIVLVGLLGPSPSWGQSIGTDAKRPSAPLYDRGAGTLPRRYVAPEVYDADKQNWDATQDTSGTFYVANTKGVLIYDGHTWRTVPPANRSLVRSVAADDDGHVFVGAQRDFGMLRRDSAGRRRYVSLLDHVPKSHRSFTDVWQTEATGKNVYFRAKRRLFRWNSEMKTMQSWEPPDGTEFNWGGATDSTFYVDVGQQGERGLMTVQDDTLRMVAGGEVFSERSVVFVRSHPRYDLVVGTFDGLFVRENESFRRLETNVPDLLRSAWMQRGRVLPDGTIAIATIDVGLLLVGPDGTLHRRLTPRDAPVPGVYLDEEEGLWALLDGGLMRYDLAAGFTEYDDRIGVEGSVRDVVHHQGTFYVATLQNFYRRLVTGDSLRMVAVPDINTQTWTLLSVGEDLLVGTVNGLNRMGSDGNVRRLFDANHVYELLRSRHDSTRVYAATGRGVRLVRRGEEEWIPGPRVPDLDTEARTLAETDDGTLWVGTSFDGVYRVRWGNSLDSTVVDHFGTDHGLPPDRIDPQRWNGELVFGTSTGLMRFEEAPTPHFQPMSSVEMPPLERNEGVTRLQTLEKGKAWGFTGWGPGRWVQRDSTWQWAPGLLHRLRGRAIQRMRAEGQGEVLWFGTETGLLRYVPDALGPDAPPLTRIQAVRVLDSDSLLPIAAVPNPALSYAQNSVTVAYGTPSLAQPSAIEYQYRVTNRSAEWSDWTPRTERELQNLSPGEVTFAVRARTAYGDTTRTARVSFTVLPPWYRTWWAYGLYGLLALGLVGGAVQWRTRQLRRRQEELEDTVAERTKEIRRQRDQLEAQADRLQELDEAKSRFLANLSHEFRTPLTLIRGPVQEVREQLARADADLDDEADQLVIAERNVDRLRRLVDQLLALARMDAGAYELSVRPTDLDAEVQRIVRAFTPLAERNDLTLTVEAGETTDSADVEPVVVDREALEHILGNLLSNAIKFTPEGGRVDVTVTEGTDHAEIAVADTGPGIPEEQQDTIFERFQRADEKQSSDREGVGIGLAFAKNLVDLHDGSIALNSTEKEGTTVTVRFPRGTDHLADEHLTEEAAPVPPDDELPEDLTPASAFISSTAARPSPLGPSASGGGAADVEAAPDKHSQFDTRDSKLVLVVDDNADVRRYVRSILSPTYAVIEAANGEEGLERAREDAPDCILADVMMPEMDGITMVRHLTSDRATDHIPVVMLTARAGTEHEIEGLEAGADDYVTKPFDADVLEARVAGMIEVRQRLRRRIREELRRRSGDGQAGDRSEEGRLDGDGAVEEPAGGDQASGAPPPQLVVSTASADEPAFVREVRTAIEEHLADPGLSVEQLASEVAVSRSTLYRRLKEHVDQTPSQFIRQVRIEHAARLLREGEGTVSEVAYAVGFDSLSYFSRQFREHLGQSPSEYVEAAG